MMVTGQWSWGFYLPTHFHPPFPSEVVREGLTESFYLDLDLAKFYRVCSVGPEQMDCVHANILDRDLTTIQDIPSLPDARSSFPF